MAIPRESGRDRTTKEVVEQNYVARTPHDLYGSEEEKGASLDFIFSYHEPRPDQLMKYQLVRAAAKALAQAITVAAPRCADRTDAIRKLREAVMTANAAIALDGTV